MNIALTNGFVSGYLLGLVTLPTLAVLVVVTRNPRAVFRRKLKYYFTVIKVREGYEKPSWFYMDRGMHRKPCLIVHVPLIGYALIFLAGRRRTQGPKRRSEMTMSELVRSIPASAD
jgi:hypothetical protein